ncbi:MAG: AbiH family protein [Clostridium sp.]|nr:AbiH family protein [Clostridium sp.]
MAVLSDIDLTRIIREYEGIILLKRCEKNITAAGYDLTIGFIRDADTGEVPETCLDDSNRYTLLPGHRYLVISKEFVYLSGQYMATLHSRGSYALKGIVVTSTTIDPNYKGCITASLFNCSPHEVYIKKDNQFITMVIHKVCTLTNTVLQLNEDGLPKDTLTTFHSKFSNIAEKTCIEGDAYYGKVRKEIDQEFLEAWEKMRKATTANTNELQKQEKIITFLIGNGFDLNVGLRTSYKDFYEYYINRYEDDMLANEIQSDIASWADLELAIGQCTAKVLPEDKEKFWRSERNLENALMNYLEEQVKKINFDEDQKERKTGIEMQRSLLECCKIFCEEHIMEISPDDISQIRYSFINFNYTDILDRCVKSARENLLIFFPSNDPGILHIHGTIPHSAVLGVNDESQIMNPNFKINALDRKRLIKKEIHEANKNKNYMNACTIINNSNIICIFGMSIGKTDKRWWNYIAEWLQEDETRKLVIFIKTNVQNTLEKYSYVDKEKMKETFKSNGQLNSKWKQIEKQIYVEVNANIFNFELL